MTKVDFRRGIDEKVGLILQKTQFNLHPCFQNKTDHFNTSQGLYLRR